MQPIAVVTGLAFEARVAAGLGVRHDLWQRREDRRTISRCRRARLPWYRLVRYCGRAFAGYEAGRLHCWPIGGYRYGPAHAHPEWSQRLLQLVPGALHADIAHSPVPISTAGHKLELARVTGAAIVDMESGLAARVASENRLPFAALRVVADPHDRALPPAAQIPLRHDGTPNMMAVMFSVMAQPGQIGSLIRVGRDTGRARAALTYNRKFIGSGFGFDEVAVIADEFGEAMPRF